jgi:hypothetical protein
MRDKKGSRYIYSWEPMINKKKNCEQANTKRNLRRKMKEGLN